MEGMRKLLSLSAVLVLALAACGGKAKPAAPTPPPAEATPTEAPPTDPELVCCTIASSDEMVSGMTPIDDCPEENRTPDACDP